MFLLGVHACGASVIPPRVWLFVLGWRVLFGLSLLCVDMSTYVFVGFTL